jgi:hypothetical protein
MYLCTLTSCFFKYTIVVIITREVHQLEVELEVFVFFNFFFIKMISFNMTPTNILIYTLL